MALPFESTAVLQLPRFWEFSAPSAWQQIDFISDLHLAQDRPKTFAAFADYLHSTSADAVFLLGDLFDVWIGDDSIAYPFEASCVEVIAEAASHRAIGLMVGNRDFLLGQRMHKACGAMTLADPTVLLAFEQRILLSHGDALCLADTDYQRFRAEVRSDAWQSSFLAKPINQRHEQAMGIRAESERRKRNHAPADWVDLDSASMVRWMHEAGTSDLIHGHTHRPGSETIAPGFVRHVLSDWDLDESDARGRAEVLRLSGNGIKRLTLADAALRLA